MARQSQEGCTQTSVCPSAVIPVLGSSQRRHSVRNCKMEGSLCKVNPLPLAVSAVGSKSKQRRRSHTIYSASSSRGRNLCHEGGCRVSGRGGNLNAVQSGTGGHLLLKMPAYTATLDSWQTWIPLIRSYRAYMCTPRIWTCISNFCYRRHKITFTDCWRRR